MPINNPTILAIDPGTKELGVAILTNGQLEYYGVKTFKRRTPPHAFLAEVCSYITSLIDKHRPKTLAIEKTYLLQRNAALLTVSAMEIHQTAKSCGLVVQEYVPSEVRSRICQRKKSLKSEAVQVVINHFPELSQFQRRPSRWEALYWAHMFDAVAVGLVCMLEMEESK